MSTIGERIKQKRNELGLTQLALGNKIHVTDRAVSKWEKDDGSPDISIVPALAKVLGVSIDYLLTGKAPEEKIIFISKIEYAAKNNDPAVLEGVNLSATDEQGNNLWYYIQKYNSFDLFCALSDKGLLSKVLSNVKHEDYFPKYLYFSLIGNKIANLDNIGAVKVDDWGEEAIDAFVSDPRVSSETTDYILNSHIREIKDERGRVIDRYSWGGNKPYTYDKLYPALLVHAVVKENYTLATRIINIIKDIHNDKPSVKKTVIPKEALYAALDKGNFELVEIMNSVNSEINKEIRERNEKHRYDPYYNSLYNIDEGEEKKPYGRNSGRSYCNSACTISEEEITLKKMSLDKNVTEKDILIYKFAKDGILDHNALFATANLPDIAKTEIFTKTLNKYYKLFRSVFEETCLCELEWWYSLVAKKDYKTLFEYAKDNKYLQDILFTADDQKILKYGRGLFLTTKDEMKAHLAFEKRNGYFPSGYLRGKFSILKVISPEEEIPEDLEDCLNLLVERKMKVLNDWKKSFTDQLDEIEKEIEKEKEIFNSYKEVENTISYKFLRDELEKGNTEIIVKLCTKLEIILRYKYSFEGTLYEMMDQFIQEHCQRLDETDWDGVDIPSNIRANEISEKRKDLLHKLRIDRNVIIHAPMKKTVLTKDEIAECISMVEEIDSEGKAI